MEARRTERLVSKQAMQMPSGVDGRSCFLFVSGLLLIAKSLTLDPCARSSHPAAGSSEELPEPRSTEAAEGSSPSLETALFGTVLDF